jgi:cytidylate kinase
LQIFKGCVIDGRDIGNKVFKNAQIKLFIDVSVEIRAKRRHKQLIAQGEKSIYENILKDLKLRDKKDINRTISPLIKSHDAILIDNSNSFKFTCNQINAILSLK